MILDGKTILVTGGTGSLGKILVKRTLSGEIGTPKKVIVFSRDEGKQHNMRIKFLQKTFTTDEIIYSNFLRSLEFRIGDIRNYADVRSAIRDVDIIVNAAALKHVPVCEYFPEQAILTNCDGANNIVRALKESNNNVEVVVGISTDKACKPINVMGMTKALQERILISANVLVPETRFICVRYGNVLSSRGSVIPLFHEQIRKGGPLTLTVPYMTRFLLTLNQAVDTVFFALSNALRGEIVIPKAPSAKVTDIAHSLICDRPIDTHEIGIRPGEKIHEIMVSKEESFNTIRRGNYYVIRPMLPELFSKEINKHELAFNDEYSSEHSVIGLEETTNLLTKYKLMINDVRNQAIEELLC